MIRRMSQRFVSPGLVKFLAETEVVAADGGVGVSFADPSVGTIVSASVQPGAVERVVDDGVVKSYTRFIVALLDDPSPLNGGLGCTRGDAFWWSLDPRLMVAQGDAVRVGSVWRVECLATQ